MTYTREWDISFPSDNRKMNNFADDIRNTRVDIGERYIDDGVFSSVHALAPSVPTGFSAVAGITEGYTDDVINRDAVQYINSTPTTHMLSSKSCPLFFDSSGDVIFGYDTAGVAFKARQVKVPFLVGEETIVVAHGIAGNISTNQKIYGIFIISKDAASRYVFDAAIDDFRYGYEHCFVGDVNITLKRCASNVPADFYVTIIGKD